MPIGKNGDGSYTIKKWFFMVSVPIVAAAIIGLWGIGYHKVANATSEAEAAQECAQTAVAKVEKVESDMKKLETKVTDLSDKLDATNQNLSDVNGKIERLNGNLDIIIKQLDK